MLVIARCKVNVRILKGSEKMQRREIHLSELVPKNGGKKQMVMGEKRELNAIKLSTMLKILDHLTFKIGL